MTFARILIAFLFLRLLTPCAAAPPAGGYTVYAVPHSHIDIEWFWTYDRTQSIAITNLRQALVMLKKDSRYAFVQDMRAALEPFWETLPAADRVFFLEMIRQKRFEVTTGMYVQPDVNEPDFESLSRQYLLGGPWMEKVLGADIATSWNIDTFGQTVQMPQLARRGGLKYLVFARDVPPELKGAVRNPFHWRSPDGSTVMSYWLPGNYDATPANAARVLKRTVAQNLEGNDKLLVGWGGDVYFPTHDSAAIEATLRQAAAEVGIPLKSVVISTARRYFEDVERGGATLPTYGFDFNPPSTNQDLRGVWAERPKQKIAGRQAEEILESAEKFASLDSAFGGSYPAAELSWGWEKLLFNQNHDNRAGSHTDQVAEVAMSRYGGAIEAGRGALDRALFHLSRRIDTSKGGDYPFVVFNPLSYVRSEVARHEVLFWRKFRNFRVLDPSGRNVPYRVLSLTHRMAVIEFLAAGMPAMGYRTYRIEPAEGQVAAPAWQPLPEEVANLHFRLRLDPAHGFITSLVDAGSGRELLDSNRYGANELVLEEEKNPDVEGTLYLTGQEIRGRGFPVSAIQESRDELGVRIRVSGTFFGARLTQWINLYDGLPRIDFCTELEGFPGHDGLLGAVFPLAAATGTRNLYETHGAVIARPGGMFNANTWAGIERDGGGVAFLNRGMAGHRIEGGTTRLYLLRSIPSYQGYHSPEAAERGSHRFEYSVYPYAGDWRGGAGEQAHSFNCPLRVVSTDPHTGSLPAEHSFVRVEAGAFEITALKRAESGDGLILRGYERHGRKATVRLKVGLPFARAWRSDLLEKPGREIGRREGSLVFDVEPFEFVTLKLR